VPALQEAPALGGGCRTVDHVVDSPAEGVDGVDGAPPFRLEGVHRDPERGARAQDHRPGDRAIGPRDLPDGGSQEGAADGAGDMRRPQRHAPGDRVLPPQAGRERPRAGQGRRGLGGETTVLDPPGQALRLADQQVDLVEHGVQHRTADRGRLRIEEPPLAADPVQPRLGQIDPAQPAPVRQEVLEVVEELQGRAKRVGGCAGGLTLTVQAKEEAADRVGRPPAIGQQLVPVGVALLDHVLAEGGQEMPRLGEAGAVQAADPGQGLRRGLDRIGREECGLQRVEAAQLLGRREVGRIGDVVRGPHEAVEPHHRLAQGRVQEQRRHGEVLAAGMPGRRDGDAHDGSPGMVRTSFPGRRPPTLSAQEGRPLNRERGGDRGRMQRDAP
jgi:hypothetical protein